MFEKYSTAPEDTRQGRVCPFEIASGKLDYRCQGCRCMAWIVQLDANGTPTGRGRCGMVQPIREMSVRDRERLARMR